MSGIDISRTPLHLGLGATAVVEPAFEGGMQWYEAYGKRHEADGREGRIVTIATFSKPWPMWEMHPLGAEVVVCTAGVITMHQEKADGSKASVTLKRGECVINEPGTWHTADVDGTASALFITAGFGTEHRPRE